MSGAISQMLGFSVPQEMPSEPKQGSKEDDITIIAFKQPKGQLSGGTPFALKIETMLRLAKLPYTALHGDVTNKKIAPKSKFPVMRHGQNVVCDSSCIVEYLTNTYPDAMKIFEPTDPLRKAQAHSLKRMLEEGLYFCVVYIFWQRDDMWAVYGPRIFADISSNLARKSVMAFVRSSVLRDLHGQGTGRFSLERVLELATADLDVCETYLSRTPYLTGSTPTQADCFLFGILDQIMAAMEDPEANFNPMCKILKARPSCTAFYQRLRGEAFPDGPSEQWAEAAAPIPK